MIQGVTHPKSVLQCNEMIQHYRKTEKGVTPDFCHKILSSTANSSVASKLVNMISSALVSDDIEIDAFLPYLATILGRRETSEQVIEKICQVIERHFPQTNYTEEEYAFAEKLKSYERHTEKSAPIAQRIWENVQKKYADMEEESYSVSSPRLNIDRGLYKAYPQRLAPDIIKLLKNCEKITKEAIGTVTKADISLIIEMLDLYEPYVQTNFKQNPQEVFSIIAGLSQASAKLSIPTQKDMCAGSLKRILRALGNNLQISEHQTRTVQEDIILLLLDAQGIRPSDKEFPSLKKQSADVYERYWEDICKGHLIELFLIKFLAEKIDIKERLQAGNYKGTAELLNISLYELILRANSMTEADWLLHSCFAFPVTRENVAHWLRYPEISGSRLLEDYELALKEGNVTIAELAQAVNRGAQANFRLIKLANGEPFVQKPKTDLRDKSIEALLNVYCEAYAQKAEPPEEVYKTIYDVRFGKVGHLIQDPRKPVDLFRQAVSELSYKKLPPELIKLTKTNYGYNRLLLKKPFTK